MMKAINKAARHKIYDYLSENDFDVEKHKGYLSNLIKDCVKVHNQVLVAGVQSSENKIIKLKEELDRCRVAIIKLKQDK